MQLDGQSWLVKSSGRILGPFVTDRIAELLRTREISVLDEVARPRKRWQTIQYHDEFKDVVESLRRASLSERTEATWTPVTSLTQTVTDVSGGELTEEITGGLTGFTATAKEIVIDEVKEIPNHMPTASSVGRFTTHGYQNTAIQRQAEKHTRGLWVVTVVVLVAIAGFILQKRWAAGGFDSRLSQSAFKQNVIALINAGKYKDALKELRAYYPEPSQSGDLAIYYGSLLVSLEQQTVPGRRTLKWVLDNRPQDAKQAYTAMGVADLYDLQVDSARQNFERALRYDNDYLPAIINLSSVALHKGDYVGAKTLALRALNLNPNSSEGMLSWAESQLNLFKEGQGDLNPIVKSLKAFALRHWSYDAETRFYSLYFDFLKNEKNLDEKIAAFLDRDPQLTTDHRHSYLIYSGRFGWKSLARYCEQMVQKIGGQSARMPTLLASCHAFERRWDLARRDIERAVNQDPKDALIQAWYAYILSMSGDMAQSSVVLARTVELNSGVYYLPILLQARFCQQKDDVFCARGYWQAFFERDPDYLPAISGLAWVYFRQKNYSEASRTIERGLKISPDYIPLLTLKLQGEQEGWNGSR